MSKLCDDRLKVTYFENGHVPWFTPWLSESLYGVINRGWLKAIVVRLMFHILGDVNEECLRIHDMSYAKVYMPCNQSIYVSRNNP